MKILHVITRMDCGGSAINTLISATQQQKSGHEVSLAYGSSLESDMSAAEQAKVQQGLQLFVSLGGQVILLHAMFRELGWHDVRAYQELRRLLKGGFQILHSHTSKAGALARLAAKGLSVQVVHTPHGHIFHGYFGMAKTKVFIAIERYLALNSQALVALTRAERDDHLELNIGTVAQWHVIPSGVNVQAIGQFMAHADRSVQWDAVSVGRLVPIKGMLRLIEVWYEVCQSKPDAKLALVGDGDERARLEAKVLELGLVGNVYFAGWAEPLAYLATARCFALLSYNEGMGRVVVEAMAAGLPCVVADVCGLKELVDDSLGCVVDADAHGQVASALLQGWDVALPERARARAQCYSVEVMIDALEQLYSKLGVCRT